MEPFVVEGHQRVIQNEGHPLVGGQHHVADGQPHRQIQLVGGALTQQADAATHRVAGGLGGQGEVPAQQHTVIAPTGDGGEDLRRPCAQRRGKAVLQHGVGLRQSVHGQRDGVVLPLQGAQLFLLLRQLGLQIAGAIQRADAAGEGVEPGALLRQQCLCARQFRGGLLA